MMTDKSKWFVFKKDDVVFGCFRIRPINDPKFDKAIKMLETKKSIFKMSDLQIGKDFAKIIAAYLIWDWENVEISKKGASSIDETRYSPEAAYQMLIYGDIGSELTKWILDKSQSIV